MYKVYGREVIGLYDGYIDQQVDVDCQQGIGVVSSVWIGFYIGNDDDFVVFQIFKIVVVIVKMVYICD